jgi:(E)-4-hydroxy-3-methylbut-2-enyl-diphosphate synthase
MNDQGADYVYTGNTPIEFMLPNGLKEIRDYKIWSGSDDKQNKFPLFTVNEFLAARDRHQNLNFIRFSNDEFSSELNDILLGDPTVVAVIETNNEHALAELRRLIFQFIENGIEVPVIIKRNYSITDEDTLRVHASTDIGGLLIDGMGDGIMLHLDGVTEKQEALRWADIANKTAFGILQATRSRMSKTEYISCPSCGRTLFDLQITTAMIRKRTDHLKGVKIGIMGCIVNGPGEMADADYGYVGSGVGKITLYRGKEVVKRNVPSAQAVDELIGLIKEDDVWIDPETIEQY